MKNDSIHPGPRPGSSPDLTTTTHTSLQATAKLFAESYSSLLSIASDDPRLQLPSDPGQILDGLERQLSQYSGPLDPDSFQQWAQSIIISARHLHGIMRECEPAVRSGLWRVLRSTTDLGLDDRVQGRTGSRENLTVELLMADVWLWCWEHLDELITPGTAKLATRLNERAYWTAREWKTQQLRTRNKFTDLDEADLIPCGFHVEPKEPLRKVGTESKLKAVPSTKIVNKIAARYESVDSWLTGFLADGPRTAKETQDASKANGYKRVQLEGSKKRLGVKVKPGAFGKSWVWMLPEEPRPKVDYAAYSICPREGKSRTRRSWESMKDRCLNPKSVGYRYYGGAGITIHPRWIGQNGFSNFLADMGEGPEGKTLDRYPDNAGNYEPGNCRWATSREQADNKRKRGFRKIPSSSVAEISPKTGELLALYQ